MNFQVLITIQKQDLKREFASTNGQDYRGVQTSGSFKFEFLEKDSDAVPSAEDYVPEHWANLESSENSVVVKFQVSEKYTSILDYWSSTIKHQRETSTVPNILDQIKLIDQYNAADLNQIVIILNRYVGQDS